MTMGLFDRFRKKQKPRTVSGNFTGPPPARSEVPPRRQDPMHDPLINPMSPVSPLNPMNQTWNNQGQSSYTSSDAEGNVQDMSPTVDKAADEASSAMVQATDPAPDPSPANDYGQSPDVGGSSSDSGSSYDSGSSDSGSSYDSGSSGGNSGGGGGGDF